MRRKVSYQGNVIEVTCLEGVNTKCHAVKVDADHWRDPVTGEIHEYQNRGESRTDNLQELRRSFAKMRAVINANCTESANLLWVTLTYRENMTDVKRLYKDFGSFVKRFRRRYGKCEYIAVPEPQRRGAWHVHLIFIFEGHAPFVPSDTMTEIWGQGFTKVRSLKDVDNIGAYLSAYLGDLDVGENEDCDEVKTTKDGRTKRIVKGGRLHLYPVGMNVYRCSRGVRKPEEHWIENPEEVRELEEIHQGYVCYQRRYVLTTEDGHRIDIIKRYYNLKRPLLVSSPPPPGMVPGTPRRATGDAGGGDAARPRA